MGTTIDLVLLTMKPYQIALTAIAVVVFAAMLIPMIAIAVAISCVMDGWDGFKAWLNRQETPPPGTTARDEYEST